MNKSLMIGGMLAAVAGASLFSGSATPIAYGASEATAQTVGSSVIGMMLTIGGLFTSAFQIFKGKDTSDLLKKVEDLAGGIIGREQTAETITAEIALVALFTICAKNGDAANLETVSGLAKSMLGKKA